jgi:VWFA-related protein
LLLTAATGLAQTPVPGFRVEVEMVSVFATVQDRAGKLVTGLGSEDFILYDDGVAQKISQFSRDYVPLSVAILLDASSSMRGKKLENAKKALLHFLKRLRAGDEVMLITFQTRPTIVHRFTEDRGAIRRELKRLDGNGSTALYDSILAALDASAAATRRRRTLLLISDGINNYGRAQLQETVARLRESGVELFAIGLESTLPEEMEDRAVTRSVLEHLTRSAGGEAFVIGPSSELEAVCARISDRMHNQYAFAYYPARSRSEAWHSLRLEARIPGLRVIASKTGYFPSMRVEGRREGH